MEDLSQQLNKLLCFWAYVSCQITQVQRLTTKMQKQAHSCLKVEMAVTLLTATRPGCGFGFTSVKRMNNL